MSLQQCHLLCLRSRVKASPNPFRHSLSSALHTSPHSFPPEIQNFSSLISRCCHCERDEIERSPFCFFFISLERELLRRAGTETTRPCQRRCLHASDSFLGYTKTYLSLFLFPVAQGLEKH